MNTTWNYHFVFVRSVLAKDVQLTKQRFRTRLMQIQRNRNR